MLNTQNYEPAFLTSFYYDTVSRAVDCVAFHSSILRVQEARFRSTRSRALPQHDLRRLATKLVRNAG